MSAYLGAVSITDKAGRAIPPPPEPRRFTVVVLEHGRLGYVTLQARDMGAAVARVQGRQGDARKATRGAPICGRVVMDVWAEAQ